MKDTITVGLACNDEYGNLDTLRQVEIGHPETLTLEGDILVGDKINIRSGGFSIRDGERAISIPHNGHSRYVGSIHWDRVQVEPVHVANLVNFLRRLPHWTCTVGESALFAKWQEGAAFTAEDFETTES